MPRDPLWDEAKVIATKILADARTDPYAESHGCNRVLGAPMHLPEGALFPIDPITTEGGRVLKRWRALNPVWGPIVTETPPALFVNERVELKPMELPKSALDWLDHKYGKKDD